MVNQIRKLNCSTSKSPREH